MKTHMGPLARSVSIVGVGATPLGNVLKSEELLGLTERELFAWAAMDAMADAGIEAKEVDAYFLGQVFDESHSAQISMSGPMGRWAGLGEKPGFKHETACATAISGLRHAALTVASGIHDVVLSCNVDINRSKAERGYPPHLRTPLTFDDIIFDANALGTDLAYWYPGGEIIAFLEGVLIAYGKKFGYSLKELGWALDHIALMSRHNALNNPLALMCTQSYEDEAAAAGYDDVFEYLNSEHVPSIGAVSRMSHLTSLNDGASAVIVCPTEMARRLTDHPVEVTGLGMSTSAGHYQTGFPMSFEVEAFEQAFSMAGITDAHAQVDYMAVHDCNAQNYFTVTETAGYYRPGEGLRAAIEGRMAPDGDKPVNTSGGRLNMGHPIAGATGFEIAEAIGQMRGTCGPRQMPTRPETAVVHGYGAGFHSTAVVLRAL
ncbi:MAG: thiolase family protein [Actinomycetota bacterium]|nr:thiolase family protein [Actinomycetota bacterium]